MSEQTLQEQWEAWLEKQETEAKEFPLRIRIMWSKFGELDGKHCKDCVHLRMLQYGNRYYKCDLTKLTHGPATDWRINWTACGKHEVTND